MSAALLPSHSNADVFTWDGEGSNSSLGTTQNWIGDAVTFNNQTDLVFSLDDKKGTTYLGANRTIKSLTYNSAAPSSRLGFSNLGANNQNAEARSLTLSAASGNAGISVLSGTSANFDIGRRGEGSAPTGNLVLGSNLDLSHAGTGDLTISVAITETGGSKSVTKNGIGTTIFSGANTYTGATNISGGTLLINGDQSAATGAVAVGFSATLGGTGTIGGATTVDGRHSAGAPGEAGTQTFSNGLSYASGSIFNWDLTQESTSVGFDKALVSGGSLSADAGATFNIALGGALDFGTAFWDQSKTWLWTDIFGTASGNDAFAGFNPTITGPAPAASVGSFSLTSTGVSFTAVPEPSSMLAGLLIGAGLLRRKRRN